jgi:Fic family protein
MKNNLLWIWQNSNYPNFTYDKNRLLQQIQDISKKQGELEGSIKHLVLNEKNNLFTQNLLDEIMYNASIEGEILQRSSVRASLRKQFHKLEKLPSDKHTDNIVSIQKDVNTNHEPLSKERLNHWHHELMINSHYNSTQVSPGEFRDYDDMYVTSGEGMRRKVHYLAPPANTIDDEINRFLNYCNTSTDNPIIKSAIAHIWFVQIHPYGDGNGRLTRNITNHLLSKELGLDIKYFSISHAIHNELKKYGQILEDTNRLLKNPTMDLTTWISWHTHIIYNAIELSLRIVDNTISKTKFYDKIREIKINPNQSKAIDMLLKEKEPMINNSIYRMITGTSQVTASRQLNDLVKKGVLKPHLGSKGRSAAYTLNVDEI